MGLGGQRRSWKSTVGENLARGLDAARIPRCAQIQRVVHRKWSNLIMAALPSHDVPGRDCARDRNVEAFYEAQHGDAKSTVSVIERPLG